MCVARAKVFLPNGNCVNFYVSCKFKIPSYTFFRSLCKFYKYFYQLLASARINYTKRGKKQRELYSIHVWARARALFSLPFSSPMRLIKNSIKLKFHDAAIAALQPLAHFSSLHSDMKYLRRVRARARHCKTRLV